LDLDKRPSLGIMTDSQPKDKANRNKAEAASEGVEERMARFEASTAKMQGAIGDLAAVLKRFMDQAKIKG
jgi:cytochrome c556